MADHTSTSSHHYRHRVRETDGVSAGSEVGDGAAEEGGLVAGARPRREGGHGEHSQGSAAQGEWEERLKKAWAMANSDSMEISTGHASEDESTVNSDASFSW